MPDLMDSTLRFTTIDSGFSYGSNPYQNVIKGTGCDNPFISGRTGVWICVDPTYETGLLIGMVRTGSSTLVSSDTEGMGEQMATGAVSGNNAGYIGADYFKRVWSSLMKVRFAISTTTAIRAFIGFSSSSAAIAGEDPLNALHGCGIAKRAADTNWQVARNDGSGATTFVDTGIAATTSATTFEMQIDSTDFRCNINGTEQTIQTTDLPASSTFLFPVWQIETSAAADKTLTVYKAYARTAI